VVDDDGGTRHPGVVVRPGDRMFVPCDGGPSISRLERFPPPLEVPERGGLYVLEDDGPPEQWRYLFVPDPI
jgi:hypothetical protein